jgi:hypothetical protein
MIESIFEGNKYKFCKGEKGSYWLGVAGNGGLFPGANCIAPSVTWPHLQSAAIEAGHERSEFVTKKKEKKSVGSSRKKKSDRPSIAIFK